MASLDCTSNLVNIYVIVVYPCRNIASLSIDVARLCLIPESRSRPSTPRLHGVDTPCPSGAKSEYAESIRYHRALWRRLNVSVATSVEDDGAEKEGDGGKGVGEPETNVFLRVSHSDGPDEGTDVDEEVEPHVDSRGGEDRVNNDPLARL